MLKLLLTILLAVLLPPAHAEGSRTLTDVAGRQVEVPHVVERIVLGEGRYIPALAMFDRDDPVRRVVGVFGEFERLDPASYAAWRDRFPQIDAIPRVGRAGEQSFSVEQTIALRPQVVLFSLRGHGPGPQSTEVLDRLAAAGIAVVFLDFRRQPLINTTRSIAVLGELLGDRATADEFTVFYDAQLARVRDRVAQVRERPTVFLENRVGLSAECCQTIARGLFADYIDAAGGYNLAVDKVPGETGVLSMEYLLESQPDIYIATAIGAVATASEMPDRVVLGVGAGQAQARDSLRHVLQRPGFSGLRAVHEGRAYAIWHHFYNSPFNVVAVQAIAKWLHPEQFAELDPGQTLAALLRRYQPVGLDGAYWVELND